MNSSISWKDLRFYLDILDNLTRSWISSWMFDKILDFTLDFFEDLARTCKIFARSWKIWKEQGTISGRYSKCRTRGIQYKVAIVYVVKQFYKSLNVGADNVTLEDEAKLPWESCALEKNSSFLFLWLFLWALIIFWLFIGKILNTYPSFRNSQILRSRPKFLTNYAFLTRILQVCSRIASFASLLQCRTFLTRF